MEQFAATVPAGALIFVPVLSNSRRTVTRFGGEVAERTNRTGEQGELPACRCVTESFMQAHARFVLPPAIAALAVSLSLSTALPLGAHAAETCLAAPKGAAPQGSHWYYRLERGSQRKCWRLVQKDQKGQGTAAQAAPQGDVDDDTEETPAPQAAKKPGGRVTAPQPKASSTLVTKDVSDTDNTNDTTATTQPVQWPDPPASMMERAADPITTPVAPAQTVSDAPVPAAIAEQPVQQPMAAADSPATAPAAGGTSAASGGTSAAAGGISAAPDGTSVLQFIFAIIAFVGLVACPIFYLAGVRLRRSDVLSKAQHLNALPAEVPAAPGAPTFQPLPPMNLMPQHDDVEEAMQRFNERWKRRAA
jgi:hypothetical protein